MPNAIFLQGESSSLHAQSTNPKAEIPRCKRIKNTPRPQRQSRNPDPHTIQYRLRRFQSRLRRANCQPTNSPLEMQTHPSALKAARRICASLCVPNLGLLRSPLASITSSINSLDCESHFIARCKQKWRIARRIE